MCPNCERARMREVRTWSDRRSRDVRREWQCPNCQHTMVTHERTDADEPVR